MSASDPQGKPLGFTMRLLNEVALGAAETHRDNLDAIGGVAMGKASNRQETSRGKNYNAIIGDELAAHAPLFPQFEKLSARLGDEASRDLLARVMAYRLMGRHAVKLPFNTPDHNGAVDQIAARAEPSGLPSNMSLHRVAPSI